MARRKTTKTGKQNEAKNGNGANLGFEAQLFLAADKLRRNLEPSDYKHVARGIIFLKYISDAFEAKHAGLLADDPAPQKTRTNTSPKTSLLGDSVPKPSRGKGTPTAGGAFNRFTSFRYNTQPSESQSLSIA
jgi:HsdM N-terminal domain